MNPKLTSDRLSRRAIIYIRQSSPAQVVQHQESQRRQYGLKDRATELGFRSVVVIDEDLGRSGAGLMERPGFQRLVAEVCSGEVGAVFCIEASRLARNGRDWHHLIELCGMVGAVVIDPDGVYDPCLINDRLLLGLKGTMSEFELNLLRQRSLEAIRQKARRGELRFCLPVGFVWAPNGKVELDPNLRVQQAIRLVFSKMTELGSARQVLLWFRGERVSLPATRVGEPGQVDWKLPIYNSILKILSNPMYAGAYAFGKTEVRTKVVDGRARKTIGNKKARDQWMVLIRDHHPSYISWEQFERNQTLIAANAHMKSRMEPKAGRGGKALLAGLLRCRRCGRMLHVAYSGRPKIVRYHCHGAHLNHGEAKCISFGGLRPDQVIVSEVLRAIEGNAVDAALEAAEQMRRQRQQQRTALTMELEQARYEARLSARRYEAVDPDNRLVSAELEDRWNAAIEKMQTLETQVEKFDADTTVVAIPDRELLLSLAQDLPAVWNSPATDMRLKQRIVRILIEEIVADVDHGSSEIVLLIHWAGGRHSELRVKKNSPGRHRRCTKTEAIDVVRQMASQYPDEQIAATLNRLGLKTGAGNSWSELRVRSLRQHLHLPTCSRTVPDTESLTLDQAAKKLGVSNTVIRRFIREKLLPATQVVDSAPWQIRAQALQEEKVQAAVRQIRMRFRIPRTENAIHQDSLFSAE